MWKRERHNLTRLCIACASVAFAGCAALDGRRDPIASHAVRKHADTLIEPQFDDDLADRNRIAANGAVRNIVSAPTPFAWKTAGRSAGNRPIQTISAGKSGYRTLVIGSLAGDDPVAIALTDALGRYVHENEIILGGIQTTIIRTLNPDGESTAGMENGNGVYLNRQFPRTPDDWTDLQNTESEIRFLLNLIAETQPQRIIHLRTFADRGIVAATSGAAASARDVARWLEFEMLELPGRTRSGTLERCLSDRGNCDVLTLAIPRETPKSDVWTLYGDAVLNLLADEDFNTRAIVRRRKSRESADRRGQKLYDPEAEKSTFEMFTEDDSTPGSQNGVDDFPEIPADDQHP